MKRIVLILLTLVMLLGCIPTTYANSNIKIVINNQELHTNVPPVIVDGRTLVPLRAIGEAMGCTVTWVNATQTANLMNDAVLVSMQIGSKFIGKKKRTGTGDPSYKEIDVAPQLINGSTYIPARAFAEALDAVVGWDSSTNTVLIVHDTSLKYSGNISVNTYAGTGERRHHDSSALNTASFVSPESIDVAADGTIYLTDSGKIRKISNGRSETVEFEPSYITANTLRCYGNDVYILTNEFQETDGTKYYGIVKLSGGMAEGVFVTEASYSKMTDFDFSNDGKMYVLQNNVGVGQNYVGQLDLYSGEIRTVATVDNGITSMSVDKKGNIYLGNTTKGSIYHLNVASGKITLFAGADNKIKLVDGVNPMFLEPRRLVYKNDALYVLDYNVLRKITINSADAVINCETLAGKISLEADPITNDGKGSDVTFASSYLMEFAVTNDGIILTDPKKAVLRIIK